MSTEHRPNLARAASAPPAHGATGRAGAPQPMTSTAQLTGNYASACERMSVVVACSEPVLALGLVVVLNEDRRLHVVTAGPGHNAVIGAVGRLAPKVVILDESAERVVRRLLTAGHPTTGILVLAHDPTPAYGKMLLAAGATCIVRRSPPADILGAVHLVARGERMFRSGTGQHIERSYPENALPLTPRELDVLKCLSEGKPHKQTAHELEIGVRTVHTFTSQICRKLGVRSKRELEGMPLPQ
jgi:DNA-binding NarL/FixJ family response regulator